MASTHGDEFKRDAIRVALTSCMTRRQVASDLGVGLSTLGKWILSCCRFRGHEDKIVTKELESGYDETKVQP